MQDIKINVSDLWKVHAKVKQYLRALDQIENASAAFLTALKRQDSVSYETLSEEWESGIIEHEEKIKERLESIADILGKYLNETGDYVSPRVRILPMRVDSLDIGFNLAQIERNVKSLSKIVTDSGGSYPDYKHAYIDYLFYGPEQKAAMLAVENAERMRRENNYRAVESFRNAVKSKMAGCMQEALDEMQRIQSDCIEPLDRADTEYGLMLRGQYLIWEGVKGVYEEKERIASDVKDALWDKLVDIFNMAIALGSVSTEDLLFYRMGWAEESYETAYIQEMESFGGDLITDPENTLGAIGQSKIDSVQENGIAYAVTGIATDIALTILIDKGMKALTGGSAKAEKVVLNQTDDALDDIATFYDDIFEQQSYVDETYADFLDDIQVTRIEDDVWVTPEVSGGAEGCLKTSFGDNIADVLKEEGLTLDEFNVLRTQDVSTLTDAEKATLKSIRESVPMPDADTLMQKVIPASDIEKYMDGSYTGVKGFVTRVDDVAQLSTYDDFYNSLRLDYPNSPYEPMSNRSIGVIRYTTDETSKIIIPYSSEMGGSTVGAPPFTGNGFTKAINGAIIPEYECCSMVTLSDGAELFEISSDGTETLKAVYSAIDGRFIPVE